MMLKGIERSLKSYGYQSYDFDSSFIQQMLISRLGDPRFFCMLAKQHGVPVGGLCASVTNFIMCKEAYADDHFLYILPEHRKSMRIITTLVAEYEKWGKELGLKAVRLTQTNGYKPDKFAKLAKYLGYEHIGSINQKEL